MCHWWEIGIYLSVSICLDLSSLSKVILNTTLAQCAQRRSMTALCGHFILGGVCFLLSLIANSSRNFPQQVALAYYSISTKSVVSLSIDSSFAYYCITTKSAVSV